MLQCNRQYFSNTKILSRQNFFLPKHTVKIEHYQGNYLRISIIGLKISIIYLISPNSNRYIANDDRYVIIDGDKSDFLNGAHRCYSESPSYTI